MSRHLHYSWQNITRVAARAPEMKHLDRGHHFLSFFSEKLCMQIHPGQVRHCVFSFFAKCKRFPQKICQNLHLYLQVISHGNQRISLDSCQTLQVCSCRLQNFCIEALPTTNNSWSTQKVWIPWATDAHAFVNEDSGGEEERIGASSSIFGCGNSCF